MHDAHAVAVVQRLEQFIEIVTNIEVGKRLIQLLEIRVVHVFKYKRWRPGHWILDHRLQRYYICTTS